MDRKNFRWIIIISVIGLLDSLWLFYLHLSGGSSSLCQISSTIHCGVLGITQYSEWMGVPVAFYAVLFYILVSVVTLKGLRIEANQIIRPAYYLYLLSILALGTSLVMGSISAFVLKAFCPFCGILYLVSIFFFWFARKALHKIGQPWFFLFQYDLKRAHQTPWFWVPVLVFLISITLGKIVFEKKGTVSVKTVQVSYEANRTLGDPKAKVAIAVFSDFLCPHCKIAGGILHDLESQMRGKIRIIYKFFPLDDTCNPMGGQHRLSCEAARAAYCASKEGKFWAYHDLLFASQEDLSELSFITFARSLSLSDEFKSCKESSEAFAVVSGDIDQGVRFNLQGTPTLFINGKMYSGPVTVSALKSAIDAL